MSVQLYEFNTQQIQFPRLAYLGTHPLSFLKYNVKFLIVTPENGTFKPSSVTPRGFFYAQI